MITWKINLVLLYCCGAFCAPSNNNAKNSKDGIEKVSAEEVSIPDNMNIADYYYSIFGKHLDYDYKEPLLTFDEPIRNELSDEIESEVDKDSGTDVWGPHSRKKRFILVPANFYNSTRRWAQQQRRLRMERRRLRAQRRQQWQLNRINYLNARSDALRRQANRLTQQRTQVSTRSVPGTENIHTGTSSISNSGSTTLSTNNNDSGAASSSADNLILSASNQIPVKQVPIPTKT